MQNYKRKILIFIAILIVLIIGVICFMLISSNKEEYREETEEEATEWLLNHNEIIPVQDYVMYFTVENIIQRYLSFVHLDLNEIIIGREDLMEEDQTLAEMFNIHSEEEKKQVVFKMLNNEFVQKNNITISNIESFIDMLPGSVQNVNTLRMNVLGGEEGGQSAIVETFGIEVEYDLVINEQLFRKQGLYIVVKDVVNRTFMIEPIIDEEVNLENLKLERILEQIEENDRNTFVFITRNEGQIAREYFNRFKSTMLSNPERAFEFLNKEYREARFGDLERFKEFVDRNREELQMRNIQTFLVERGNGYIDYVAKDQFENIFVFRATAAMVYTVKLDTYTIETPEFLTAYRNANRQQRVSMNVDKWFMMLNNRDYAAAFNVLNEEFRTTRFVDKENFEAFMRQHYPLHYTIRTERYTEEGRSSIQTVTIRDIQRPNEIIATFNIVMQLREGTGFEMSFSVE